MNKRSDSDSADNVWFPSQEEYTPGITVQEWVTLLNDKSVFTQSSLEIMKRFKDYGGAATCTQLAVKYGESMNFYNAGSVGLAKRVVEKTGCPVMPRGSDNSRWWTVLYVGRHATKDEEGSYIWKLRSELSDALDRVDLKDVDLYAKSDNGEEEFIMDMIRDENPLNTEVKIPPYTKDDFLSEVYMTEEKYDRLAGVLLNKMNIILQGLLVLGRPLLQSVWLIP